MSTDSIAPTRPPNRSFNSWDSLRYSQRQLPTIASIGENAAVDTFALNERLEANSLTRRPSVRIDESNPVAPTLLYRLGWRSYVQIWAALATTTTLCIACANLYARLHGKRS